MLSNVLVFYTCISQGITKELLLLVTNLSGKIVNFCKLTPKPENVTGETIFWFCYFKTTVLNKYYTGPEMITTMKS